MGELEQERQAVADFLRAEAVEYEPAGPFGKVACACLLDAANKIERGEHRP